MSQLQIEGLSELHKALQNLPLKIEANVLRGAVRAGAKVLESEAKANAPVDDGDLRKSIRVSTKKKGKYVNARVVAGDEKAYYATVVEFGSGVFYAGKSPKNKLKSKGKAYTIKPKNKNALAFGGKVYSSANVIGIKPNPFMRKAFDEANQKAFEATADYLRKRIPKEVAKNAR